MPYKFVVILGSDGSGKSSVMTEIARGRPDWRTVSTDSALLHPEHELIARLRRNVVEDVLPVLGRGYSAEFLAGMLQTAVLHLRDRLAEVEGDAAGPVAGPDTGPAGLAAGPSHPNGLPYPDDQGARAATATATGLPSRAARGRPVIMDSYYYKILAKCRLAGVPENPMFAWWRTFPQPDRVVYLDCSARSGWQRSGHGARLNPLEYSGPRPTRAGFAGYQRRLRELMLQEVRTLPVTHIGECDSVTRTARAVLEALDAQDGPQDTAPGRADRHAPADSRDPLTAREVVVS